MNAPTTADAGLATTALTDQTDGREALQAWLAAQAAAYAEDVRWSAPRRGVAFAGRADVVAYLAREIDAMIEPRMTLLRHAPGAAQSVHEFALRFRLGPPGIDGVALPVGAEVELERLRVLTHDASGRIAVEVCIETWTWLPVARSDGSRER